jgi:prepilin signal peptidase PulO-like enzyme (type II secretory pathway)
MLRVVNVVGYGLFAMVISSTDIKYRLIRNRHLLIFAGFTFICNFQKIDVSTLKILLAVTLILAILHLLFPKDIGSGDLKLFWVISFWSHSFAIWLQLFSLAWVLGGAFSAISAISFWKFRRNIPFAPFIFLAFIPSIAA